MTTPIDTHRQPAGQAAGGQFSAHDRGDAAITLDAPARADRPAMAPGDTAEFTIVVGGPDDRREERVTGFIQQARLYENGAMSVAYRYASNPHGITWSCYIEPEHVDGIVILERNPEADISLRSMLPG